MSNLKKGVVKDKDYYAKHPEETTCEGLIEQVPTNMRDNEKIKTGYRINQKGFCQIFGTVFKFHNQSFNIWSHMFGFALFFSIGVMIYFDYPNQLQTAKTHLAEFQLEQPEMTGVELVGYKLKELDESLTAVRDNTLWAFARNNVVNRA